MMNENLRRESERLASSWMRYEAPVLQDYLVQGVEDPRLNLQSILSRHFVIYSVLGARFVPLMEHEYLFAAALNSLNDVLRNADEAMEREAVLHALRCGADNAEGLEIPRFLLRLFPQLPAEANGQVVPNYLETALSRPGRVLAEPLPGTFGGLWRAALAETAAQAQVSVLEPACGSANDYRAFAEAGVLQFCDYTGIDLCEKNIENARRLFPVANFQTGNVFELGFADRAFDLCFVHDLLEHLSPEGIDTAVAELCRVTRRGLCVHFFNMDEIPAHQIRPVEEYYWNRLSMGQTRDLFDAHGFTGEVLHIGTFLREHTGWEHYHNPNAYTFRLARRAEGN